MGNRDALAPYLRSTFDLLARAYPDGWTEDQYWALLTIFHDTPVSRRAFAEVLACIDGRPYLDHLYDFRHEAPHRTVTAEARADAARRLGEAGFDSWLHESD